MKNWILSLFTAFLKPQAPVQQSGMLVIQPKDEDWKANDESGIVAAIRMPDGDWRPYTPTGEKQYRTLSFDSLSCATFSGLNYVEIFIKYLTMKNMLSKDHLDFIRLFNFLDENKLFNASDNFTAIMSGTTAEGNSLPAVWNSIKNNGLVAEKDFPFVSNTFADYHDKTRITNYLKARGEKFKEYFTVNYQWVTFASGNNNTPPEMSRMSEQLKQAPLHVGVPIPAIHAEDLILITSQQAKIFFNSYEPYVQDTQPGVNPVHFSMQAVITPKINVPKYPSYFFAKDFEIGATGIDVTALQKILNYFGFMSVVTGTFGSVTEAAVKEFQRFNQVDALGRVGPLTRGILNSFNDMIEKTGNEILLQTAISCLNTDVTPEDAISDELDCADTVNTIHRRAFGQPIGGGASTYDLYQALLKHPHFIQTTSADPGSVIISPTGFGKNADMPHGHVGIIGLDNVIMSNNSSDGLFKQNFTLETWRQRYVNQGEYPMFIFKRV